VIASGASHVKRRRHGYVSATTNLSTLGARRGAADQRVLSDEARDTSPRSAPYIVTATRSRTAELQNQAHNTALYAELQHRRHGAQIPRCIDGHFIPAAAGDIGRPAPTIAAHVHGRRQDRAEPARAAAHCTSRCATISSALGGITRLKTRRARKACTPSRPAGNTRSEEMGRAHAACRTQGKDAQAVE